jgi:hypothetical protein
LTGNPIPIVSLIENSLEALTKQGAKPMLGASARDYICSDLAVSSIIEYFLLFQAFRDRIKLIKI